jgi:hypothetical protein
MPQDQAKAGNNKQPEFYGMDQVLAVFADVYVVAQSGGAYTLYFFQSQLPETVEGVGQTKTYGTRYKCVGKVVLASKASLDKFLEVVKKNLGGTK